MHDAAVTLAVSATFLQRARNLSIASGEEIVPNSTVELLRCQASRQKVPGGTGDIVL